MSLLIIGRNGQLAQALQQQAAARRVSFRVIGRPAIDLEIPDTIAAAIDSLRPSIVINAAAFTAVDKAEDEPERAFRINAAGAEAVAKAANAIGAPIVHVSTDYVFSGDKNAPYVESDVTAPQSVYGASKLEGERLVSTANPAHVIVRTAWVYDAHGQNFVRTMLRLAKTRQSINVVDDQLGCPTSAASLATALLDVAGAVADKRAFGVFHCASEGETSWADFARAIFEEAAARGGPVAAVAPIPTSAYPTRAKRPHNSILDCTKIADAYAVRLPHWRAALSVCLDEIAADKWSVE